MLATLGDLIDDVVVHLDGPVRFATDTPSVIERRRGGSAANTAAAAAALRAPVRFLGQVGDDARGTMLTSELTDAGVDTQFVRRNGRTGTIVVLVDRDGERSMLTDRGASTGLSDPRPEWLDGVTTLHVPLYSLHTGPLAATASALIGWAQERSAAISIDLSSTALIDDVGVDHVRQIVRLAQPDVIFANSEEADHFGLASAGIDAISVIKDGARAALLGIPASRATSNDARDETLVIPAIDIDGAVDTTGAGDAFAAGFLTTRDWSRNPSEAVIHGHRSAHALLTSTTRT